MSNLLVDFAGRLALLPDGRKAELTLTEFNILAYLFINRGYLVEHDELLRVVWGPEWVGNAVHILQTNISRLRKKLGDPARNPKYIKTRQGGYIIEKD